MAAAHHLIEVMLDQCKSDDAFESNVNVQKRRAIQKSLESSKMLMGIAHQLMVQPESMTLRDSAERSKTLLNQIKIAARTAYEAGFVLTGSD
ncbi:hypothetical protein QTI66_36145 [Variovorax sp. J22R133]|uniref:hypothetical protein n=1 Tax=Variovorax brevis TaxID=3053503 RepID=UPI00257718DA|nr:hypothetical protein [Variovorax sp. J22R133]MDM0117546.1 hypothetical protein [Variovorax sp. J22R133]